VEEQFDAFKKDHVISLKTLKGVSEDMVMQAHTKKDYKEWVDALKSFAKKMDDAKNSKI